MAALRRLILTFALCSAGCVHRQAWVIEVSENGGLIGYRSQSPSGADNARVRALIPCDEYHVVYDREKSTADSSGRSPANAENGGRPSSESWYELRYLCRNERSPGTSRSSER